MTAGGSIWWFKKNDPAFLVPAKYRDDFRRTMVDREKKRCERVSRKVVGVPHLPPDLPPLQIYFLQRSAAFAVLRRYDMS